MSDSPPDSWYDPPNEIEVEIKWERPVKEPTRCETCEEPATVEGEVGQVQYSSGMTYTRCGNCAENVIDEYLEGLDDEPDIEED